MHLVFIYGAPACGKLTIAKLVAKRTGFALFHNHLIVDALLAVFPFASPEFVALRERFWLETVQAAALSGRSLVFTFCPEPTVTDDFPKQLAALVEQVGGRTSFARLEVSEEEQERRLVLPSRTGGKLKRVEVLRSWRDDFANALAGMPPADLALDTTMMSPDAAATEIVDLITSSSVLDRTKGPPGSMPR
jgi:chloramphenicol 3-O-phosphotransferase